MYTCAREKIVTQSHTSTQTPWNIYNGPRNNTDGCVTFVIHHNTLEANLNLRYFAYANLMHFFDKKIYINWKLRGLLYPFIQKLDYTMVLSLASCQIRKIVGCACAGSTGNVFPATASCVTPVPWCMPGLLTSGFLWSDRENVPVIPGTCATRNFPFLVRGP